MSLDPVDRSSRRPTRALVFDFDGTLVDSGDIKVRAYRAAMTSVTDAGADTIEAAYRRHGTMNRDPQLRAAYRDVTDSEPDPATAKAMLTVYSEFVERERAEVSPFPGIADLLAGHRMTSYLAIASNAPRTEVIASCEAMSLRDYFDEIYGFPMSKEDAIATVMSEHRLAPERVTYVGDRREDGEVAASAGVPFCRFGPLEPDGEDEILRTVAELESALGGAAR